MKFVLGILAVLVTVANCLPRDRLFPFGEDTVDKKLSRRSKQPLSLALGEPFTFLGGEHSLLYILRDGYVSFSPKPRGAAKIAPFNAKLKIQRGRAFVWYRTDVSATEEEKIVSLIRQNFPSRGSFDVGAFQPSSFVIVTWDNLAVRNGDHELIGKVTFQLVLAADATHSFAFFLYADENEYPTPAAIGSAIDVGFTSGKDLNQWEFEMVYTSEANKAAILFEAMRDSNVGVNGMWAYQIDGRMDGNIITAVPAVSLERPEERPQADAPPPDAEGELPQAQDPNTLNTFDVEVMAFEDQCARETCSANGRCVSYPTGYCCSCDDNYIGNGIYCWNTAQNGRITGNVNGTLNGFRLPEDVYLHSFVAAPGGRTYTAISPVPDEVAYTMQLLLPIGELFGWLFAERMNKGINGFMQTGGDLRAEATITFDSGDRLSIVQQFTGMDETDQIRGFITIDGNAPNIPPGTQVTTEKHSEVYTKYQPGFVYSSEQRTLSLGDRNIPFTVEQTITFEECEADDINTDASLTAMRMNTSYAYTLYEAGDQIIRYAMITTVGPDEDVTVSNPCENNNCGVNANCRPQGTAFSCQCRPGYTGNGYQCTVQPSNPCANNNCDSNADCTPSGQSFTCQCSPPYVGDGYTCTRPNPCDNSDCSQYATCSPSSDTTFYCECAPGYSGDGRTCIRDGQRDPCDNNDCSRYAYCYQSSETTYYCQCAMGYIGDGRTCTPESSRNPCENNRCDQNAQCRPVEGGYTCSCNPGYQGDGYSCTLPDQLVSDCRDCSPDAECLPERSGFRCLCRAGYQGNGITCDDIDECVEGAEIACDQNAQCYNSRGSYSCYCRAGYRGDGFRCEALPEAEGSIVFGQGMSVMHLPLDGSSAGNKVYMKVRQTVVGLGYDCVDEKIYWTDVSGHRIMRSSVDGRDARSVVNTSLSSPEGIAIDHLSRNMYWTDSGFDRIEVANLDGRNRHVLFDTDIENPRGIAVDPVQGYLYWADWDRSSPRIERSAADGSDRSVLVDTSIIMPNGLTIDLASQLLCWADAGTQKLECMSLTGDALSRYTVYTSAQYPFGLASLGTNLYWTDWQSSNIQSINKNGGQEAQSHSLPRGGNGKVYGVAAVTACPDGNNRCAYQNGGCRNLCLPGPNTVATCVCPNALASNEIPCN